MWLGHHTTTKEKRVFKFCFRADRVRALKREVTLFRLLKERVGEHPNVVRLQEVFFDEPPFYIEMEYVEGRDLKTWTEQHGGVGAIPLETLEIVAQVADALQAAHEAGVIHRDVKPSNILIGRSSRSEEALTSNPESKIQNPKSNEPPHVGCYRVEVKLTDFGIGQVVSQGVLAGMTRLGFTQTMMSPGSTVQSGTQMYMAPELIAGKPASTRSDIYSLGVVLYQLLVSDLGRPLTTDWRNQITDSLLHEDLERCFSGNPAERFVDVSHLAASLRALEERRATLAKKHADLAALERAAYRRGVMRTAAVAAAVVGVFVMLAFYAMKQQERAEAGLSPVHVQTAEKFFAADDAPAALAYLARALRLDPNNRVAAERLISALSLRNFPVLTVGPLKHDSDVLYAEFSPDGKQIVTASGDKTARVWSSETAAPLTPPLRHSNAVLSAQFSYDAKRIITSVKGGCFRLWESRSGKALTGAIRHSEFHTNDLTCAGLSPNRRWIVSWYDPIRGWNRDSIRAWDVDSGILLTPLAKERPVELFHGGPEGRGVIAEAGDQTVEMWDLNSMQLVSLLPHPERVWEVELNSTGDRAVSISGEGTNRVANVWDTLNGRLISRTGAHSGLNSAWFDSGGDAIVTMADDDSLRFWNLGTGEQIERLVAPVRLPCGVDTLLPPDPDNSCGIGWFTTLGTIYSDRPIYTRIVDVWTGRSATERLLINPPPDLWTESFPKDGARFSPDRQRVVTYGSDQRVRVWDVRNGRALPLILKHGSPVLFAQFSPDGRHVATASADSTARVWNLLTGQPVTPPLVHSAPVNSVQFSPDSKRVVTASDDGRARVWDATTGTVLVTDLRHNVKVNYAEFSPDGERIVTASADKTARLWNAQDGEMIGQPLTHEGNVFAAHFRSNGFEVITASSDGAGRLWDLRTGQPEIFQHESPVLGADLSPKPVVIASAIQHPDPGKGWEHYTSKFLLQLGMEFRTDVRYDLALTASADNSARLWKIENLEFFGSPLKHEGRVNSAQFSLDGQKVVTASADKTARIWQASTGQALTEPLHHAAEVHYAEFSPDGLRVVTASADKTARLWDAHSGQALSEPLPHDAEVLCARFSPDGRWVVTTSRDHTAKIWEVPIVSGPAPNWLANLAEAVANQRLDRRDLLIFEKNNKFLRIKKQISHGDQSEVYTRWAKWFFADRALRSVSVSSQVTVPEYVQRLIRENDVSSLHEALRLSPANEVARAELRRLSASQIVDPRKKTERETSQKREQPETLWGRAELLRRIGKTSEASQVLDQALISFPHHAGLWQAKGTILHAENRFDDAYRAYSQAIAATSAGASDSEESLRKAFFSRSQVLDKLNRPKEARSDYLRSKRIPERDSKTPASCVDLSAFYNAGLDEAPHFTHERGAFSSLPRGLVSLAGIEFDIRGLIYTNDGEPRIRQPFPTVVNGIPVSLKARRIHFLHAANYSGGDLAIGTYVIHYFDGGKQEIPIILGVNICPMQLRGSHTPVPRAATLAWAGKNRSGQSIGIFLSSWDNPKLGTEVSSIDFLSLSKGDVPAPFLIAITVEP